MAFYTIGLKRRFGLFFRKHKVTGHEVEVSAGFGRLVLTKVDGSYLIVPGLDRLTMKIYPDYRTARALAQAERIQREAPPVEG